MASIFQFYTVPISLMILTSFSVDFLTIGFILTISNRNKVPTIN